MARINIDSFRQKILQDNNGKLNRAAFQKAKVLFEEKKEELLQEFEDSEVTQEIEGGADAENLSDTIVDPNGDGNLYSFIGFESGEGEEEIEAVRTILESQTVIKNIAQTTSSGNKIKWQFGVFTPKESNLEDATPMPFGTAKSWLRAIERNISGIAHYLYRADGIEASRSGTGIQVKGNYRKQARFQPVKYVFAMLENFKKGFK